jgi:hypothetical protein
MTEHKHDRKIKMEVKTKDAFRDTYRARPFTVTSPNELHAMEFFIRMRVAQLVLKFVIAYRSWRFTDVLTRTRH